MAEPSTTTFIITGAAAAALGPVLGPYVLIAFSAAVGSLLALSRMATQTHSEGFKFVCLGMLIALVLAAPVVLLMGHYTSIPGNVALMPVAFFLGAGRNHLLSLMDKFITFVGGLMDRTLKKGGTP